MTTVFRSKVDKQVIAAGCALPCVLLLAVSTTPARAPAVQHLAVVATFLTAVVVLWVVLSTYYAFEGTVLVVRSGPFVWRVPLRDVTCARESASTRSGPALSLERIEITYGNGRRLLISPADRADFLAALHRRAPHLAPA